MIGRQVFKRQRETESEAAHTCVDIYIYILVKSFSFPNVEDIGGVELQICIT